jgi:hypothetical protein
MQPASGRADLSHNWSVKCTIRKDFGEGINRLHWVCERERERNPVDIQREGWAWLKPANW